MNSNGVIVHFYSLLNNGRAICGFKIKIPQRGTYKKAEVTCEKCICGTGNNAKKHLMNKGNKNGKN